jgi:hypothetical protein
LDLEVTIYHQNGVKYGRYHVQSRKNFRLAMLFNGNLVHKTNDRFTQWLKFLSYRIERRAVVELTNGWLSGFINAEDFLREFENNTRNKWDVNLKKFSLTQASEFQILKEIFSYLKANLPFKSLLMKITPMRSIIKSKFKVYYRINFY